MQAEPSEDVMKLVQACAAVVCGSMAFGTYAFADSKTELPSSERSKAQMTSPSNQAGQSGMSDKNGHSGASAQTGWPGPANKVTNTVMTAEQMRDADVRFIKGMNSGNKLEIALSEYVLTQTQNPTVKAIADRVIKDHTELNQKLSVVATQSGVDLSSDLMPAHQAKLDSFKELQGEQAANMYLFFLAGEHRTDVLKTTYVANNTENKMLKDFANAGLPKLKEHADMINSAADDVATRSTVTRAE
jgi:putative membrane protein